MPCPRPGRGMLMRNSDRKHCFRPEAPYIFFDSTLPPLASQAFAFLAMVKLCPLQSFLPLQSWLALLQLPLPLQSFVPSQWTPFAAFALAAKATAGAIIVASAPAIATPFIAPFFILRASFGTAPSVKAMSGVRAGTAVRLRTRQAAGPAVLRRNAGSCFGRMVPATHRVSSAADRPLRGAFETTPAPPTQ